MVVDNFMPAICWTPYFIVAQGYNVKDNPLHQYNKISIILEGNGKASSSKRKKHIIICGLNITDSVKNNEVSVVWCPTAGIIGEYITKRPQVAIFRKFRDQIMGVIPASYQGPGNVKVEQLRRT